MNNELARECSEMKMLLSPFLAEVFPTHLLTAVGFNKNFETEEIVIKLHITKVKKEII